MRARWLILSAWLAAFTWVGWLGADAGDWEFFRRGATGLLGHSVYGAAGGVHLYAASPDLQIGPPALVVAIPFHFLPRGVDLACARVLMCLCVLPLLVLLDQFAAALGVSAQTRQRRVLFGGLLLIPLWMPLGVGYAHLDDVLVLLSAVWAARLVAAGRLTLAGIAVGVAIAMKPWGLLAAPILLCRGWRRGGVPITVAVATSIAPWLPFLLADSGTLHALWNFRIPVGPSSSLTALGVSPGPMPAWVRPTQLISGLVLGAVAARRGRWEAVLLVGFAMRVALDPSAYTYYDAAPVVGALVWDFARHGRGLPVMTAVAASGYSILGGLNGGGTRATLLLILAVGLIAAALLMPRRSARDDEVPSLEEHTNVPGVRS